MALSATCHPMFEWKPRCISFFSCGTHTTLVSFEQRSGEQRLRNAKLWCLRNKRRPGKGPRIGRFVNSEAPDWITSGFVLFYSYHLIVIPRFF